MTRTKEKINIKYGKDLSPLFSIKRAFFSNNEILLNKVESLSSLYSKQPIRKKCMNCLQPLKDELFERFSAKYYLCGTCGHLNGGHVDTDEFCRHVYTDDEGKEYAKNYEPSENQAYKERVSEIYKPKAQFLIDALSKYEDLQSLEFADIGCGCGHFLVALKELGVQKFSGYEVSEYQAKIANHYLGEEKVYSIDLLDVYKFAESTKTNVVSLIGVLEHLQNPYLFLDNLKKNKNVEYLYISVPLFSPAVFFESIFDQVFPRLLSMGHTHLYSKESLEWLYKHFGFSSVAEWWFGTDMMDLYRSISIILEKNRNISKIAKEKWKQMITPMINSMQLCIDQNKLSSEVHVLLKVNEKN